MTSIETDEIISLLDNLDINDYTDDDDDMSESEEKNSQTYSENEFDQINFPSSHRYLLTCVNNIIKKDPRYIAEIVDNVVIIKNILYGIKLHSNELDTRSILRLPDSCNRSIPRRNDLNLWEDKFEDFDILRNHLREYSYDESNAFINNNLFDKIEKSVIELACTILQKECEDNRNVKFKTDLLEMYKIASYLERYYYANNIGSFFTEKQQIKNEYFIKFNRPVLEKFSNSLHYLCYKDLWEENVNDALLKVLRGAQNTLLLFGPYGYDALLKNEEYLNKLNLKTVFEYKRETLRFFALNILIDLKLDNKKIHLYNPSDYVNFIFDGAHLIN